MIKEHQKLVPKTIRKMARDGKSKEEIKKWIMNFNMAVSEKHASELIERWLELNWLIFQYSARS